MPLVMIPALLRDLTGGLTSVQVPGANVREVIQHLEARYPGVQTRLCENDQLRPTISLIVDGAASPQRLRHKLQENSEIHFLPAISGGSQTNRPSLIFPTPLHEQAAETAYRFFQPQPAVDSVLVVNSCARGQAVPESDLDMAVLVGPGTAPEEIVRLEGLWREEMAANDTLRRYTASGKMAHVHLDVVRGQYLPETWDDGGGPDGFELEIGNQMAYAAPFHGAGAYYRQLQAQWLPYYGADLRQQRLEMARSACAYDLEHVPFFVRRELYFQAFDRLYKGFQEFLQALFIARRVYPLAYNKWIRMQVEEWLGLPELYRALPAIISVQNIESREMIIKAEDLMNLLHRWVVD